MQAVTNHAEFLHTLKHLYPASHYAVAVSGGNDSLGMLALIAHAARDTRDTLCFTIITVDHKIRPEALDEAQYVKKICAKLNLPHVILSPPKDWTPPKTGIQAKARQLRYRLMQNYCAKHNIPALILAHHMHDQAETLLMRLAHASSIDGLAGMTPCQNRNNLTLLRPFLATPPSQLAQFAHDAALTPITDPSNHDTRFERVRIRNAYEPLAAIGLTPEALSKTATHLAKARIALDAFTHKMLAQESQLHPYGFISLNRAALDIYPHEICRRALIAILRYFGDNDDAHHSDKYPPRLAKLDTLLDKLRGNETEAATLAGVLFRARRVRVLIGREPAAIAPPMRITAPANYRWDGRFMLTANQSGVIAPLGADGLAAQKRNIDMKRQSIPVAFLHSLPLFTPDAPARARLCPILPPAQDIGKFQLCAPLWQMA